MAYRIRTSIHGRRLALSSTGAIIDQNGYGALLVDSTGKIQHEDTAITFPGDLTVLGREIAEVQNITSAGGETLTNYGVSVINTTATTAAFLLAAPVAGVAKEIYVISAAAALTFGGTSTSQVFMKVGAGAAGSTTLTLTDINLAGQTLLLRGLSATKWGVMNGSTVIQA